MLIVWILPGLFGDSAKVPPTLKNRVKALNKMKVSLDNDEDKFVKAYGGFSFGTVGFVLKGKFNYWNIFACMQYI